MHKYAQYGRDLIGCKSRVFSSSTFGNESSYQKIARLGSPFQKSAAVVIPTLGNPAEAGKTKRFIDTVEPSMTSYRPKDDPTQIDDTATSRT